ncbi:MAG: metal-dependent hydrolase [Neisseriaceae bacterium]|nr:metal-dependent hydrolase [Neisseriaceae bacterium]
MDSLTQIALGAAVAVAVMGRHTSVKKAAFWGAVAGTLPDLDVLINYGDVVLNTVLHRGHSHALFWITLFSVPFGVLVAKLAKQTALWRRWSVSMWLAMMTHPLLDTMTVYGTQLAMPFSNYPYAIGSIFIIDLLYTVPLLLGTGWALKSQGAARGLRANQLGLLVSTAYLSMSFAAQYSVTRDVEATLTEQGLPTETILVTPTAFNTLLWRVVVISGDTYYEGYRSLFDHKKTVAFKAYPRHLALSDEFKDNPTLQRIQAFSHGFYALKETNQRVSIRDLRMGQEPSYSFTFTFADRTQTPISLNKPEKDNLKINVICSLQWVGQRIWHENSPDLIQTCPIPA